MTALSNASGLAEFTVLGVRVHAVQIPGVIDQMQAWIAERRGSHYIAVTGMHGVTEAQHNSRFKQALAQADLVVADGMPVIWLGRRKGHRLPRRVYGPELLEQFWDRTAHRGYRHFFYGGSPGIADKLAQRFALQFPTHTIAGTLSPPFRALTASEDREIVDSINHSQPDVLWIGLGTPKQELWMHEHRSRLQVPVMIGVGAAFDFHAGSLRQAPMWMGDHGLEWLFRLAQEPGRLWRRYLITGAEFLTLVLLELAGFRKFQ
jgi:N-acetylglucosaminyldiphosphoundecaprenol N-acetyl-beta-D-mannosaminyltransferase